MPKIIGISGIGGSGKSTLTKALSKKLNATALYWDDFDEISESPSDYVKWYETSKNYNDWKYDALADVLKKLKSGEKVICPATKKELLPTDYVIFDAPLGRKHKTTGQYIDYCIFLDTPLDIALARRLLRNYRDKNNLNIADILLELDFYLASSRPLYEMDYQNKDQFDLIADGSLSTEKQVELILKLLSAF